MPSNDDNTIHQRPPDHQIHPPTLMHPSLTQQQTQPSGQPPQTPPPPPAPDASLPNWPKRVSKACCSCRRDKIRCDGARPCAGCLKKGFQADKCIDGCLPCRRARARCEGGMPCTRCQEMSIPCVDEASTPPPKPDPALKAASKGSRGRTVERAKLACLACRRDNKKCDDQRPCTRCQTRSEECIHVMRGPKVVKLRCKACRRENRKCEDQRPCKFCNETGEQCADVPRKGRGHGTRVKTACINCRRDKIQCGTDRPCKGCVRRGYECIDRTCQCAEKGTGQECTICRVQKSKMGARAGECSAGVGEGEGSPRSDHEDADGDDDSGNPGSSGAGPSQSSNGGGDVNVDANGDPGPALRSHHGSHVQQQPQHPPQQHSIQSQLHAHVQQRHPQHQGPQQQHAHVLPPISQYNVHHHGYQMQPMLGGFHDAMGHPHNVGPAAQQQQRVMYTPHHQHPQQIQHSHHQQHPPPPPRGPHHHQHQQHAGQHQASQHHIPNGRQGYYPVIDPSIDDAPVRGAGGSGGAR